MDLKLVSFKQAKELKTLGFPQSEFGPHYKINGEPENGLTDLGEGIYTAPSLELAAKFIREEKKFAIVIESNLTDSHSMWINDISEICPDSFIVSPNEYKTYEEALSDGLDRIIEVLLTEN